MASNSDSLFFILSYIKRHPADLVKAIPAYDNVIRLFISDKVKVSDAEIYFPDNSLMVNRLKLDFISQHGKLLDDFFQMTGRQLRGYHEVWASTAHLTDRNVYLVELSYE